MYKVFQRVLSRCPVCPLTCQIVNSYIAFAAPLLISLSFSVLFYRQSFSLRRTQRRLRKKKTFRQRLMWFLKYDTRLSTRTTSDKVLTVQHEVEVDSCFPNLWKRKRRGYESRKWWRQPFKTKERKALRFTSLFRGLYLDFHSQQYTNMESYFQTASQYSSNKLQHLFGLQ